MRSLRAAWSRELNRLQGDRLDRALVGVFVALTLGSAITLGPFGLPVHFMAEDVDLVIATVATVVTLAVAALAWARYAERREPIGIFQASAFIVSAVANGYSVLVALDEIQTIPGVAPIASGPGVLYVTTIARLLMGALLVGGATPPARRLASRFPVATLAVPPMIVLALIALLPVWGGSVPSLSTALDAAAPLGEEGLPNPTLVGALLQIAGALLFLAAAATSRRLYVQSKLSADGFLAVGLVVAAFSQLHFAVHPGTYPGLVTSGDLLGLLFDFVLLLGIEVEARSTLTNLRLANKALERLKEAEVDQAGLEERARLARELQDGLTQNLWLAKLKLGRLSSMPDLGPEATALSEEAGDAVDAGLAEARQAMIALRFARFRADAPLPDLIRDYVAEFAERFGLPARFESEGEIPPIDVRARAELLRIVQEALSNVRRHADASLVTVRVVTARTHLVVTVRDNGRGFDAQAVEAGIGLPTMRERAALINARLTLESRPLDGTTVTVELPLPGMGGAGSPR